MHSDSADMFLHLGDGISDALLLQLRYPDIKDKFHTVKGNCDFFNNIPEELRLTAGGYRIFAVHGHNHYVKTSLEYLIKDSLTSNSDISRDIIKPDIILFGHTHKRYCNYRNNMHIMNPGSAAYPRNGMKPSYGLIEITNNGILLNIVNVP